MMSQHPSSLLMFYNRLMPILYGVRVGLWIEYGRIKYGSILDGLKRFGSNMGQVTSKPDPISYFSLLSKYEVN